MKKPGFQAKKAVAGDQGLVGRSSGGKLEITTSVRHYGDRAAVNMALDDMLRRARTDLNSGKCHSKGPQPDGARISSLQAKRIRAVRICQKNRRVGFFKHLLQRRMELTEAQCDKVFEIYAILNKNKKEEVNE